MEELLFPAYANDERLGQILATGCATNWSQSKNWRVRNFIAAALVHLDTESPLERRHRSMKTGEFIRWNVYLSGGVLPANFDAREGAKWLIDHCKAGEDVMALRLLQDGMDPDLRLPGTWTARRYAKQNREVLPKTWAWLCRQELTKKAAKARKPSWASGALVERRAL